VAWAISLSAPIPPGAGHRGRLLVEVPVMLTLVNIANRTKTGSRARLVVAGRVEDSSPLRSVFCLPPDVQ
jgi:hypothetical protein